MEKGSKAEENEKEEMEETKEDSEPEIKLESLDNSNFDTLFQDTSEFEVAADRLEQVLKSMETLLTDVEDLRSQCSFQATELMQAAADLRQQQEELKESYAEMAREMQDIVDSVEELFSTKSAFETKEKEMQKLSRQFWDSGRDEPCFQLWDECTVWGGGLDSVWGAIFKLLTCEVRLVWSENCCFLVYIWQPQCVTINLSL